MFSAIPPAAAIFDMDGVLVNSNPFHVQKWIELLKKRNIPFDQEAVPRQILGMHNDDAFRTYFGSSMTREGMRQLGAELEAQFRKMFRPYAKPLPGLTALLGEIKDAGIPMAVASSAIRANVDFVVDTLRIRAFFRCVVSGDDVTAHKPHPEIYLKAAADLGVEPAACVAFEDSFPGIAAVKNAGMVCIAIASTFPIGELRAKSGADMVAAGFEELSLETLRGLFAATRSRAGGRD
ncbi:MAG: HAD family hydrolase [Terriglobia bacterium]